MRGLTRDSIGEMISRKGILLFGLVTLIASGLAMLSRFSLIRTPSDSEQLQELGYNPYLSFMDGILQLLVFMAVMASAGIIPRMLERGRADFYLSKPLTRVSLLAGKLIGIWIAYGLLIISSATIVAITLAVAQGEGDFGVGLLLGNALIQLAIWLSLTSIIGVVTGSQSAAITGAFMIWVVQLLLSMRETYSQLLTVEWPVYVLDTLYYIFPKPSEVGTIFSNLAGGLSVESWQPLATTIIACGICTLLALSIFKRKDC